MSEEPQEEKKDAEPTEEEMMPLATIGEVFSFAETTETKAYIAMGVFFAIVAGLAMPASLFYFSAVLGDISAIANEGLDPIIEIVYAMMILGVISLVSETMEAAFLETAANIMTENLKRKWFAAVVRQDMAYFDLLDVSGTATIVSTNGAKFKKGLSKKLGHGVQFTCTVLAGFGIAFYASWQVSLVVLGTVPVMALSTGWVLNLNQSKTARDNASYSKAGSIVYQVASSIRTILALNAGDELIDRFTTATEKAYDGAISQLLYLGIANGCLMGSFMLAYIVVVGYGSFLLYKEVRENGCDPSGAITENTPCSPAGEDVFLALMGVIFAGATIPQISTALEAFTGSRAACFPALLAMSRNSETGNEKIDTENLERSQALTRRSSIKNLPKYIIDVSSSLGEKPASVTGCIEFHDVSFSYPTRSDTKVFNNFNLKIEAGKTVALVGPSGSGKSTTVQLIERFYDPAFGMITLDGIDLRALNVSWLRQHVGLVSQEPTLFATTIKENIKIAKPDATDEEIENAARRANAHDFIVSLQDGYDTQVGDRGAQLSGGQKQRVAIARTLITSPKIILLDEATSALDSESEAIVQEALDVIMSEGNATVVVIAHRLSTIKNADMIAVVDNGSVAETGTHDELIAKEGKYYDLVQAQKGKVTRSNSSTTVGTTDTETSDSNPPSRTNSENDLSGMDIDIEETAPGDKIANDAVINLKHVHFTYPARQDNKIFRGLGLEVHEGETLAIVGPSGQGKSTIIQLIEEFYRPSHGKVSYNGDDLVDLNVRWYRNELGLVSQEPTLFDGTIAENIKFGMPEATMADIEEAAKKANAHNFIVGFPDAYETMVGTASSSQISGGQKQRVAIARALLRKPKVLLLDEATSALDSESEKVVQAALDNIMADSKLITIVIAHRLSTIRGANKIAFVDKGKVREVGSYEELMAKPNGHYKRLESLQTLDSDADRTEILNTKTVYDSAIPGSQTADKSSKKTAAEAEEETPKEEEIDEAAAKANEKKAKDLAKEEYSLFVLGSIGALLQGITFPGQGFVFAFLIEVFYQYTLPCEDGVFVPDDFASCQDYWDDTADHMRDLSLQTIYLLVGLIGATMIGNIIMFQGFGRATERINKRVRDKTFRALIRQEVAWYDVRSVGEITSQLSDDAAMIHSFSGEPIRTFMMTVASVGAGLIVSFYFMWEFAFVALGILPFMAFGEYMQTQQMIGEDEGDIEKTAAESSEGAIVIETLVNIRVVASLSMEEERTEKYSIALKKKNKGNTLGKNTIGGAGQGMGSFFQMWGYALMFYFGSWLMENRGYGFRAYLVSLFGLMLSLTGLAAAMSGLTDAEKAKAAAHRIFELTERVSEIDPLSDKGKKQD